MEISSNSIDELKNASFDDANDQTSVQPTNEIENSISQDNENDVAKINKMASPEADKQLSEQNPKKRRVRRCPTIQQILTNPEISSETTLKNSNIRSSTQSETKTTSFNLETHSDSQNSPTQDPPTQISASNKTSLTKKINTKKKKHFCDFSPNILDDSNGN